ncbi:winged helix-turn-helix domain-containing protein [Tepidiforma sp.]|uniref:winged helix-turn-helix transcriptional regulator n=1 Tax=Tepidiforma sp. TaxID=2682230 RepID=UPI00260634BA|nr:winged helix-turn-helix domain-containing protein [Tepidiforma sp.]MCX7616562.1 winged helix-turn-helix domain-containing protein [Tepidiforma sp.]
MPRVLIIDRGLPGALEGRSLLGDGLEAHLTGDPEAALERAAADVFDLLVLCGMPAEEQAELAAAFHVHRRWRLVPVLYVSDPQAPGLTIPATFRPEVDGIVRGSRASAAVERRIRELAREGVAGAEAVVAGPFELDPVRLRLHSPGGDIDLTEREAEVLSLLLARPNRTVPAADIIERGWGLDVDERSLQILRRHISNIRRKLAETGQRRAVRTVRGTGYRFEVRAG